jgi:hypothetical protein
VGRIPTDDRLTVASDINFARGHGLLERHRTASGALGSWQANRLGPVGDHIVIRNVYGKVELATGTHGRTLCIVGLQEFRTMSATACQRIQWSTLASHYHHCRRSQMSWHFQTVFVKFSGSASNQGHPFPGVADFSSPDQLLKISKAECALKSFHMSYHESDHHFKFQRIAIRDVMIAGPSVRFNIETGLKDDSDDANAYAGEVEVLVIADVSPLE